MSTETLNSVECRKATIEVGFEIVDVLQPDVEPQGRSTRRQFGRRTIVRTVKRNHKALEAAPPVVHGSTVLYPTAQDR